MPSLKAALYDFGMRLARGQLDPRREQLVADAGGRVLELGIGTGQNLRFYGTSAQVIGIEPDPGMLERAKRRGTDSPAEVQLVAGRGESLPFRDGAFDEVVAALVL